MTLFDSLANAIDPQVLCWTLIHFLWQGCGIALLLWMAQRVLRVCASQTRYCASCLAMFLCIAAPVSTVAILMQRDVSRHGISRPVSPVILASEHNPDSQTNSPLNATLPTKSAQNTFSPPSFSERVATASPQIVGAWVCGAFLLALWRLGGWIWAWRLRHHGASVVDNVWVTHLARLQSILGIKRAIRLVSTARLDSPAVMGCFRPVILLPVACLANLTPGQVEAILAHELAHIRRHDYLLNLMQIIIETALFFHPAVWWISSQMTNDREDCCDDIAADVCGDPLRYAGALTVLETLRAPAQPVLAATGGVLLRRIRRIVGFADATSRGTWWPLGAVAAAMLVLLIVQGRSSADEPPTASAKSQSLEVVCLDESGKPVPGAEIYFVEHTSSASDSTTQKTVTDARGIARVESVPANDTIKSRQQMAYARIPGKLAGFGMRVSPDPMGDPGPALRVFLRPIVPYTGKVVVPEGIDPTSLHVKTATVLGIPPPETNMSQTFSAMGRDGATYWPELFERSVNADGTFVLTEMPAGCSVYGEISGPGIATQSILWARWQDLTINVDPEAVLEGQVVSSPPGAPLQGLTLTAVSYDRTDRDRLIFYRSLTRPDGKFRFDKLAQGTYQISIEDLPDTWISAGVQARVRRGEVRDVQLRLERGVLITGVVTDAQSSQPLAGATLSARSAGNNGSTPSAPTDADGRFSFRVPQAALVVSISRFPDGYAPSLDPVTHNLSPRPPQARIDLSTPEAAANPPAIDFRLEKTSAAGNSVILGSPSTRPGTFEGPATLRGRVVDPEGHAVPDARIRTEYTLPDPNGRPRGYSVVTSRADGSFELRMMPNADENGQYLLSIERWNTTPAASKPFTPKAGQTTTVEDLVVTPRPVVSKVSGILQDERRRPVASARVSLSYHAQMTTAADGRFQFDLYDADQPVTLQLQAPSFDLAQLPDIPAGSNDLILTLLPRPLVNPGSPPSPADVVGKPAPAVHVLEWYRNAPAAGNEMPLIRTDGKRTVLLFLRRAGNLADYGREIVQFDQICRKSGVVGVVLVEPIVQEYMVKKMLAGSQLTVSVGIDQPIPAKFTSIHGQTKTDYGAGDLRALNIVVIEPNGQVHAQMQSLEDLDRIVAGN